VDRPYLPAGSVGLEQHDRFVFRDPRLGVPADVGNVFADLPRENALERDLRHGLAAAQDPRSAAVLGDHGVQTVDLPRPAVGEEPYFVARKVNTRPRRCIDKLLSRRMVDDPRKMLSELARLGARLIIQRAVQEEFESWLGRARYERRPERQRVPRNYGDGYRNGYRPRRVLTAEGELEIEIPQVREAADPFVCELFRVPPPRGSRRWRTICRTPSTCPSSRTSGYLLQRAGASTNLTS
jgi:Transposase, Mutator family